MNDEKKPNTILRRERQLRGWSQQKVAGLVGTSEDVVNRWERGERKPGPFYQEKFCVLYGKSAEELGFLAGRSNDDPASKYDMLESVCESNFSALERKMIIKRRELLQLLSVAVGALFIPGVDWERIEASLTKPSHIDITVVNDLEAINSRWWDLFMTASSKSSVLDEVLGQLKMLIQLLKASQTTRTHQHLCTLVSSMSQLAGRSILRLT